MSAFDTEIKSLVNVEIPRHLRATQKAIHDWNKTGDVAYQDLAIKENIKAMAKTDRAVLLGEAMAENIYI